MAHHRKARRAEKHNDNLPALTLSRIEPRREYLAVSARKLALKPCLRRLRRDHLRRMRRLDKTPRTTRNRQINRNEKMGPRRSIIITAGISTKFVSKIAEALHLAMATSVWIAVSALVVMAYSSPGTRWAGASRG